MGQYQVRHQCDNTCGTCGFRVVDIYIDSFGEHIDQYCKKDNHTVDQYTDACEWYSKEGTYDY